MRKLIAAGAVAAALGSAAAALALPRLTPDQQLAKLLEGRTAGKPAHCISEWDSRDMQVLDKTALVYGSGRTIWVNRPRNAEHLDSDDVLVEQRFSSELCNLDIIHTMDRSSHFTTGFINLGEFVPYTRVPPPPRS